MWLVHWICWDLQSEWEQGPRLVYISFDIAIYEYIVALLKIWQCTCRILLTSTSEVYGDPLVHPQDESYWGNVNPIGMFAILLTPYLDMVYLDFFEVAFLLGLNLIAS